MHADCSPAGPTAWSRPAAQCPARCRRRTCRPGCPAGTWWGREGRGGLIKCTLPIARAGAYVASASLAAAARSAMRRLVRYCPSYHSAVHLSHHHNRHHHHGSILNATAGSGAFRRLLDMIISSRALSISPHRHVDVAAPDRQVAVEGGGTPVRLRARGGTCSREGKAGGGRLSNARQRQTAWAGAVCSAQRVLQQCPWRQRHAAPDGTRYGFGIPTKVQW